MKYKTISNTDLKVSRVCLGTCDFGSSIAEADSFRLLDAFAEKGGTFVDTAHVYADWACPERSISEKTIGKWLRTNGMTGQMIVATKGAHPSDTQPNRLAREEIIGDLDRSREYLGLDKIPLYWLHRDDPNRPVADILETMNECVLAGKIAYFGASNWRASRLQEAKEYALAHGLQTFCSSQINWSLGGLNEGSLDDPTLVIMDKTERDWYVQSGMTVLGFASQAKGYFSKLDAGQTLSGKAAARYDNPNNRLRLQRAQELAQKKDASVGAIVLAYIACHAVDGIPIIGSRSVEQLYDSLAGDPVLTSAEIAYLEGQKEA